MRSGMPVHQVVSFRSFSAFFAELGRLCAGRPGELAVALREKRAWTAWCVVWIVAGGAAYGCTLGLWQWGTPQPLYVAIKLPLLLLLTALGNGVLNGMLGQLLGLPLSFRESLGAILSSFAIVAVILGSLAPVVAFLVVNTPAMGESGVLAGYRFTLLFHVGLIAFAGVTANLRLYGLLRERSGSSRVAMRSLFAWLLGNLLLGSQLSWILRPFIGSPHLQVAFLRPNAFEGSFFEAVYNALSTLIQTWSTS